MLTISHIKEFAFLHSNIAYILIAIGVIVEGEFVVISSGILAHLGFFNITLVVIATFIGAYTKSFLGYKFGVYLKDRHSDSQVLYKAESRVNHFFPHFKRHQFWSIFIARFLTFGLHWLALIYSGYKKVEIKTYIKAESISLLIWTTAMISLGYFFSYTAIYLGHDIRKFIFITLIFFISFFVIEKVIAFFVELFENEEV